MRTPLFHHFFFQTVLKEQPQLAIFPSHNEQSPDKQCWDTNETRLNDIFKAMVGGPHGDAVDTVDRHPSNKLIQNRCLHEGET